MWKFFKLFLIWIFILVEYNQLYSSMYLKIHALSIYSTIWKLSLNVQIVITIHNGVTI